MRSRARCARPALMAARKGDPGASGAPGLPGAQGASGSRWIRPSARRSDAQPGLDTRLGTPTRAKNAHSTTKVAKVVHEKPTSLTTEVKLYSSTSLPSLLGSKSLGRKSQRDPTSAAIERALDDPRALDHSPRKRGHVLARDLRKAEHGLDAGAMSTLRRLDLRWSTFRRQSVAPVADSVFSPVFESKAARNQLTDSGGDLSQHYNSFGMGCLAHSPDIAFECLQRALFTAPRDSQEQALALSHLGVHAQSQNKTSQALRYLHRAVAVQAGSLASRVRVRLNLCAALNQQGDHPAALKLAEAARLMLVAEAEAEAEQPSSPGSSMDGERAGLAVEDDVAVLRALAHHNCCVCHEHLGRTSLALQEARRATRLARAVLEEHDPLLQQLEATEESVGVKERLQLSAAGRQQAGHLMRSAVSDPGLAQASAQQKAVAAAKLSRGSPKLRHRSSRTLLQSLTKSTAATDAGRRHHDRASPDRASPDRRTVGVPRAAVASLPALGEGSPVRATASIARRGTGGGRRAAEATAGLGSSRVRVGPGVRSRPQPDKPSRQQGARQGGGGGVARGGAARSDGAKERRGGSGGGGGGGGGAKVAFDAEEQAVTDALKCLKAGGVDHEVTLHGWRLRYKLRGADAQQRGDWTAFSPSGKRILSFVNLSRHFENKRGSKKPNGSRPDDDRGLVMAELDGVLNYKEETEEREMENEEEEEEEGEKGEEKQKEKIVARSSTKYHIPKVGKRQRDGAEQLIADSDKLQRGLLQDGGGGGGGGISDAVNQDLRPQCHSRDPLRDDSGSASTTMPREQRSGRPGDAAFNNHGGRGRNNHDRRDRYDRHGDDADYRRRSDYESREFHRNDGRRRDNRLSYDRDSYDRRSDGRCYPDHCGRDFYDDRRCERHDYDRRDYSRRGGHWDRRSPPRSSRRTCGW